jgi:alpha-glucosidase
MNQQWNRRDVLKGLISASTALVIARGQGTAQEIASVQQMEIQISSVSAHTFRLSVYPLNHGAEKSIPFDGSLVQESWGAPAARLRPEAGREFVLGSFRLKVSFHPVSITVTSELGAVIQQFIWDENTGVLSFLTGSAPLFGLGEGGPQFDRRGSTDAMRSGQGGYKLPTHGGRVPIPWIIGASG